MSNSSMRQSFQRALGEAGKRWRMRIALHGLWVVIAGGALASALAVPFMDARHFAPASVGTARVMVYLLLLALVLFFLVARVPRRADRQRLIAHLEGQDPQRSAARDTLLLTAAQMDAKGIDAPLEQRLYERAAAVCDDPMGSTREDRAGLRRATRTLLALLGVIVLVVFTLDDGARHGLKLLLEPWRDAQQGMPYRIAAHPGDTTVRERSDVAINGSTQGFVPSALTLVYREEGEARWSRTPMQGGAGEASQAGSVDTDADAGVFSAQLLAVTRPFEYYLAGDNVRSPTHRVQLRWLPKAERIDHVYHYPRYAALADRVVEHATDISAVSGSTVQVRVLPQLRADHPSGNEDVRGELVLDDSTRRALIRDGELLTATLSVDEATRYRIELRADDAKGLGAMIPVTPDHGITALADGAPVVTVARPASDTRVTAIEEIAVQVQADDDVSLRQVELVYSINGEAEEVVALTTDSTPTQASVTATHKLYLEQRKLKPGDVIAYHARASDGVVSRTAVTDIQFMEVRPFDRDYRRGRSGGGGGGGGGRRNEESLAAQQRDLVVALFRLARDSQGLPAEEQAKRLTTLSDAQRRIRERVEAIVRRIQGRAMVQDMPGYLVMLEVMPKAGTAMSRVEALLTVPDAEQALPPAREALAHLQRADAAFREVQLAAQQGGGGGGGGMRNANGDLSRLFELEMDRFRNRYSQVQRAQAPQHQQQVDESLDKLKELARRQREEVERARRRANRPRSQNANEGSTGGGAATQEALAQALDELLRQLERLSREQPSAAMDAARQAMQQAAQSMRQSMQPGTSRQGAQQANQQGNQQSGNQQGAQQAGESGGRASGEQAAREALERLDAARQALAGDRRDQLSRSVQQAQQRAEALVQQQAQVEQRLQAGEDPGPRTNAERPARGEQSARNEQRATNERSASGEDAQNAGDTGEGNRASDGEVERRPSIIDIKTQMQADARQLREQLDRLGGSDEAGVQVQRPLRRAGEVMREEDVEGRLGHSRDQLAAGEDSGTLEPSIAQALERVHEQLTQAAEAATEAATARSTRQASQGNGQGANQRGGRGGGGAGMPSGERLREMMRELGGLRDRMSRGGGASGIAGPGGRSRDDLRDLARDLTRIEGRAFGPVASNDNPAGDLRTLIEGIEALAAQDATLGGHNNDALLDALARVERLVKGQAEADRPTVPTGRDARMPREYRALVESYYRRLSDGDERAQQP